MKRSLDYIYQNYPNVKKKREGETVPLTNVEEVFYQLSLFCEEPERYSFNIGLLYQFLKEDDLSNALNALVNFFEKDTYLISDSDSLLRTPEITKKKLYNQTNFSRYLCEHGHHFPVNKLNVYIKKGVVIPNVNLRIPKADVIINNKPYWFESTVRNFERALKRGK